MASKKLHNIHSFCAIIAQIRQKSKSCPRIDFSSPLWYPEPSKKGVPVMPKSDNQKLKILYILDYLKTNSQESKPVRTAELIHMLERQHNISCDRKTVYSDIAALQQDVQTLI